MSSREVVEADESLAMRLIRRCTTHRSDEGEESGDHATATMRRLEAFGAVVHTQEPLSGGDDVSVDLEDDNREGDSERSSAARRSSGVKRGSDAGMLSTSLTAFISSWVPKAFSGDHAEELALDDNDDGNGNDEASQRNESSSDRSSTSGLSLRGRRSFRREKELIHGAGIKRRQSRLSGWINTVSTSSSQEEMIETYRGDLNKLAHAVNEQSYLKPQHVASWLLGVVSAPKDAIDDNEQHHAVLVDALESLLKHRRASSDANLQMIVAAAMLFIRLKCGLEGPLEINDAVSIIAPLCGALKSTEQHHSKAKTKSRGGGSVACGVAVSALVQVMQRASDPREIRDKLLLEFKVLDPLEKLMEKLDVEDQETRRATVVPCLHLLDFICTQRPYPARDSTKKFVPVVAKMLPTLYTLDQCRTTQSDEDDIYRCDYFQQHTLGFTTPTPDPDAPHLPSVVRGLIHAMSILSALSDGSDEDIELVVQQPQLLNYAKDCLSHSEFRVYMPALRLIGNVVTGNDDLTQTVIDVGAMPIVINFLDDAPSAVGNTALYREALWMISNVLAGPRHQISTVIELGAIPKIATVVTTPDTFHTLKTEALWCLRNALAGGSISQVHAVLDAGCIDAFVETLRDRPSQVQDSMLAVESISETLRSLRDASTEPDVEHEHPDPDSYEDIKNQLRDGEGVDILDRCARGGEYSGDVTQIAQDILRGHFNMSSDEWVDLDRQNNMLNFGGFSMSATFSSLSEAVQFWTDTANEGLEENDEKRIEPVKVDSFISPDNLRGVLVFLSKLRISQEFQNTSMQSGLARRVMEALETLATDEYAREEIITRMVDSVDTCGDKPIWALNQISLVSRVAHARGDKEKLREVGRGVMNLDIVHQHARRVIQKFVKTQGGVDDVCVYLRFEIDLRKDLDLPVSAEDMIYSAYVNVDPADLDAARQEALGVDDEGFEAWLQTWPEWVREERREFVEETKWSDLEKEEMSRNSLRDSLTNLFGDPVEDPIRLLDPDHPGKRPVWSMSDLLRHWEATGMDLHGVHRSTDEMRSNLRRCIRRASIKSMLSMKPRSLLSAKSSSRRSLKSDGSVSFVDDDREKEAIEG